MNHNDALIDNNIPTGRTDVTRRMRPALGTYVEVGLPKNMASAAAFDRAYQAIAEIERLLSFQNPDSELSRLNNARGKAVKLSNLSVRVIRLARAMTAYSGGLFNCTLGGALVKQGALPDHGPDHNPDHSGDIPLDVGMASDIEIQGRHVRLCRPLRLTLDGIAKGFAVDWAVLALKSSGISAGWINAGGDLRVFGQMTLPLERRETSGPLKHLGWIENAAVATSASRIHKTAEFPALLLRSQEKDKLTKPPAGVWTVMAAYAWRADALTKVAALLPPNEAEPYLMRLGGRLIQPKAAIMSKIIEDIKR